MAGVITFPTFSSASNGLSIVSLVYQLAVFAIPSSFLARFAFYFRIFVHDILYGMTENDDTLGGTERATRDSVVTVI